MTQTVVEPKCVCAVFCLLAHLIPQISSSLTSMATKVVGARRNHKTVNYILPPCTDQPNQPKKKGSDGAAVLVEHLLLANIQFSSEYLLVWRVFNHVGPCSVRYLPYILCKSHIFTHYWSLYKFYRLMLVFGARFCRLHYWACVHMMGLKYSWNVKIM